MVIPKLRSPIIFVHGLLGFNQLCVGGLTLVRYFMGIPEALAAAGNRCLVPWVSPTGGVARRAAELKDFINQVSPHEPVHLLGHSMGGLDARYMVSRLGMADRVLTVTTLGTPHRGTPFADWGIKRFARLFKPFFEMFTVPPQAFYDLTTARSRELADEMPDAPGVRYFSVAGRCESVWNAPEWHLSYHIVRDIEGPNDGMVSLTSAKYGENFEVWEGDHLSLVNFPNPLAQARGLWQDRVPHYVRILRRLADAGY